MLYCFSEHMTELIITEKPKSALKIAQALADKTPKKETYMKSIPFYRLKHNNKDIIVGCAVGHLYGLAEKDKAGWIYPVFDIEWKPIFEAHKTASFSKKYINALKKLAKEADEFTVACDYDIEGETIGLNIIRYIAKKKDANRMKFSTLTKDELIEAYEHKSEHLDWGQAKAGETRHFLDFYYGINLSRALTSSIKTAGSFKVMSTGRVQGPALKLLAEREKEIRAFVPEPFWQIELIAEEKKKLITAMHETDKFWKKGEADKIYKKIKSEKKANIFSIKKNKFKQTPPHPFDLTSLQVEAYKLFGISPKETLAIAQELYTSGIISYPRTSSQQLPPSIKYEKILNLLSKQINYHSLIQDLIKKPLKPNNGKKTDPAHPAIYPTGESPKSIDDRSMKIYDLIVKRTLATFADEAERETMEIKIDCKKENFVAKGTRTTIDGWHKFYQPYVKLKEEEFPELKEGKQIKIKEINLHDKETQPPKRYHQASIIRELEKRNLGTKATRAHIVDTLAQRGYITGKALEVTELGMTLINTLEKYSPDILDEELTRQFELEMEKIRQGKAKEDNILKKAKDVLMKTIAKFKKHEKDVGTKLLEAKRESQRVAETLGPCPKCGHDLKILSSKKTRKKFVACTAYPECTQTYSLPQGALIIKTEKICDKCKTPIIKVIRRGKRPFEMCLDPNCETKANWGKKTYKKKEVSETKVSDHAQKSSISDKTKEEKPAPKKKFS